MSKIWLFSLSIGACIDMESRWTTLLNSSQQGRTHICRYWNIVWPVITQAFCNMLQQLCSDMQAPQTLLIYVLSVWLLWMYFSKYETLYCNYWSWTNHSLLCSAVQYIFLQIWIMFAPIISMIIFHFLLHVGAHQIDAYRQQSFLCSP